MAYIFGTKCGIHNQATELETTSSLPHKMSWTWVHKCLGVFTHPP